MLKIISSLKRKYDQLLIHKKIMLYKLYLFLHKFPFTRKYIANISNIYRIMKPTDEHTIAIQSVLLFLKANTLTFIIFFLAVNRKGTTIYNVLMIFSIIYIIHSQIINCSFLKEEYKLLKQFEKYLGEVRHYFHSTFVVEDAIYDSLEDADYEISLHINKIYDLLVQEDANEISNYKDIAPNKFLMTFSCLCQVTIIYGDTICENKSLFLSNINYLKNELNIELLKRNKINHLFSGLIFMTIFPIFFLKLIENWSIQNLPELEKYYYGTYGIVVTVIIFLSTLLTYYIIHQLKDISKLYRKQHTILERIANLRFVEHLYDFFLYKKPAKSKKIDAMLKRISEGITLKQFLVQKVLIFLISFVSITFIIINMLVVSQYNELSNVINFELTSYVSNSKEERYYQELIKKYANHYVKEYQNQDITIQIEEEIKHKEKIKNPYVISLLAKEIVQRLIRYDSLTYQWYYFFLTLLVSYLFSNVPYLLLYLKKQFLRMSMEDEVMGFQAIIMMLMYIKRMNVETVLEWLENFSDIFKPAIIRCVDHYSYDEEEAFLKLKEEEPFMPFVRIVENLEVSDRVGIERAFDEIVAERSFFMDKRKQENEIFIINKAVIGKVIAYIPLFLTLSLYLIIPFVLESITKLMSYVTQLQGIY